MKWMIYVQIFCFKVLVNLLIKNKLRFLAALLNRFPLSNGSTNTLKQKFNYNSTDTASQSCSLDYIG